MALGNSIVNKIVNIKDMHIERYDLSERVTHHNNEEFKYVELVLHARPYKRKQCLCPECMKKCPVYDHQAADELKRMKKEFAEAEAEEKQEIAKTEKALEEALKRLKSMPRRGRPSKEKKELQQYAEGLKKQLNSYQAQSRIEVTEDEYRSAKEELSGMPKRGRRSNRKQELMNIVAIYEGRTVDNATALSSAHKKILDDLKKKSKDLKGTKYALGMNPENLSQSLKDKLKLISETQPVLFKAYQLKEKLRIILHMKDVRTAEMELDKWIEESSECEID